MSSITKSGFDVGSILRSSWEEGDSDIEALEKVAAAFIEHKKREANVQLEARDLRDREISPVRQKPTDTQR